MKYRKLRITWSVAWGVLCLLLVALWVRSSQHLDEVAVPTAAIKFIKASSVRGQLGCFTGRWNPVFAFRNVLKLESFDAKSGYAATVTFESAWYFYCAGIQDWEVRVPHWFVALVAATIAATPWIGLSWRFSLRTLLIAMALAAVGLGWAVYANRN